MVSIISRAYTHYKDSVCNLCNNIVTIKPQNFIWLIQKYFVDRIFFKQISFYRINIVFLFLLMKMDRNPPNTFCGLCVKNNFFTFFRIVQKNDFKRIIHYYFSSSFDCTTSIICIRLILILVRWRNW